MSSWTKRSAFRMRDRFVRLGGELRDESLDAPRHVRVSTWYIGSAQSRTAAQLANSLNSILG